MHSKDASQAGTDRATRSDAARQAEHIVRIRQRVADGAYNDPSVVAHVARRLMDGGEVR